MKKIIILSFVISSCLVIMACDDEKSSKSCQSQNDCAIGYICQKPAPGDPGECIYNTQFLCTNNIQDKGESDVDCGGACPKCTLSKKCNSNLDCGSNLCSNEGKCIPISCATNTDCSSISGWCDMTNMTCYSCTDMLKNGEETDIDCGGPICGKCVRGKKCKDNSDCETNFCLVNTCEIYDPSSQIPSGTENNPSGSENNPSGSGNDPSGSGNNPSGTENNPSGSGNNPSGTENNPPETDINDRHDETSNYLGLLINEVMGSPDESKAFDTSSTHQCEYIELANTKGTSISVDGLTLMFERFNFDSFGKKFSIPLTGEIIGNGGMVVAGCDKIEGLPDDILFLSSSVLHESIDDDQNYQFWITDGSKNYAKITRYVNIGNIGVSQTRYPDFTGNGLILSSQISGLKQNSPGYCSNGGTFSKKCLDGQNPIHTGCKLDFECMNGYACLENGSCSQSCDVDNNTGCVEGYLCTQRMCVKTCQNKSDCDEGKECKDYAEFYGEIKICDTPTIEEEYSCTDGEKNGNESDVDCGGGHCPGCDFGKHCNTRWDCMEGICGTDHVCAKDTPAPEQNVYPESFTIDFEQSCLKTQNCTGSGGGYDMVSTFDFEEVSAEIKGLIQKARLIMTGNMDRPGYIKITGLKGLGKLSFDWEAYNPTGDKGTLLVTVGTDEQKVEFAKDQSGTFSKEYNNPDVTSVEIRPETGTTTNDKKKNEDNRLYLDNLTWTTK